MMELELPLCDNQCSCEGVVQSSTCCFGFPVDEVCHSRETVDSLCNGNSAQPTMFRWICIFAVLSSNLHSWLSMLADQEPSGVQDSSDQWVIEI